MFNFQFCYSWTRWFEDLLPAKPAFLPQNSCPGPHHAHEQKCASASCKCHDTSSITNHHKTSQIITIQMKCQSVDVYMRTQQYQNNANAANKWNVKKRQPTVSVVEDLPAYFCCAFSSQHLLEFSVHL
jgi:hypothetical protein